MRRDGTGLLRWAGGLALLALGGCGREPPQADPAATLEREVAGLRADLELAEGRAFYLRLDPERRVLELVLNGVALESHPLLSVEQGRAHVAYWPRPSGPDGGPLCDTGGRLDPPRERDRLELEARPGTTVTAPAPPTAEDSVSVPPRWRVHFDGGLTIEVVSPEAARNRGRLRRAADRASFWIGDRRQALAPDAASRTWLRIALPSEAAASLYRTLPPDVAFVLSPSG